MRQISCCTATCNFVGREVACAYSAAMNPADYTIEQLFNMYRTHHADLPPLQAPEAYGLEGFAQVSVPWGQGEQLHLWQRFIDNDRPTYVVFHGVNGHWGHLMPVPGDTERYNPQFRMEWLKAFPKDVNLIAVSMPGFGQSTGQPSRPVFDAVNAALVAYVRDQLQVSMSDVIAAGESLGANHALNFAATAHEQGSPVFQVTAVAPFRDIATVAADVVELGGWVSLARRRQMADNLFGASSHLHDNFREIDRLKGSGTQLVIVSGGRDEVCRPRHQRALAARASANGLCVAMQLQDEAGHTSWDSAAVVEGSRAMRHAMSEAEGVARVWQAGQHARKPVPIPVPDVPQGPEMPEQKSSVGRT